MADHPQVAAAKARLKEMVIPAVDTLDDLLHSDHAGIRLGAAREILDRGGVPARTEHNIQVDLTMDEEIEQLIGKVRAQHRATEAAAEAQIEDAVIIEEQAPVELPVGELAADVIAMTQPEREAAVIEEENTADIAWWQAAPE